MEYEKRPMATNQGESSTQDNEVKQPYMMAQPGNLSGNESGQSPEGEWGTSSGTQAPAQNPSGVINGSASSENRSAKFKAPNVSQDQGAGANQY